MTSTPETSAAAPFSRIKIRTGALVFCGDDVALIRRDRAHSSPGNSQRNSALMLTRPKAAT
ncbi:hypothetical protein ABZ716_13730 [Streptomyces sp. NPDC006687]|uniref:hypothetical protein n=1 Tax=unclassified Streptomyces TaxID=2593676 RepID=UPI0033FA6726